MSTDMLIQTVMAAGVVAGVALAWFAYSTGIAKWVLILATVVYGTIIALLLLPVTLPVTVYVWHVFYRRPPAPKRRGRHVLKGVTA